VIVLGIETSCDETAAAVVAGVRDVLSNVVRSQVDLHRPYGGVVPEIASRHHVEVIHDVVALAVQEAGVDWVDVEAVAVTYGPGLASSLLVGLATAKTLALRLDRPLCAVNHLNAHMTSAFLSASAPSEVSARPYVALVVSGGHTCLVRVDERGAYRLLGQTIDDAAGEAFDKGANLLGLGYPGGPAIDRAARGGRLDVGGFPRGRVKKQRGLHASLDPALCFSYSGLKTALLYYLRDNPVADDNGELSSVAASYQEAIVDTIVTRCDKAMGDCTTLSVGGGVSLNSRLRGRLEEWAQGHGYRLLLTEPRFCADNAAMIAAVAAAAQGIWGSETMALDASPSLPIG